MPNQPAVAKRGELCPKCGHVHERCVGHAKAVHGGTYAQGIKPCPHHPVRGADVCRTHGGSAPRVKAKAERNVVEAEVRAELFKLGVPLHVDPREALREQIAISNGAVAFLTRKLQELGEDLTGHTKLGSEEARAIYRMWCEERDRLAKLCKLALDINLADKVGGALGDLTFTLNITRPASEA